MGLVPSDVALLWVKGKGDLNKLWTTANLVKGAWVDPELKKEFCMENGLLK